MNYDEIYYRNNRQDRDRPALWMYERFWRLYCAMGPVLEFGCGLGYFARRLSRYTKVFALETNQLAMQQIRKIAPEADIVTKTSELPDCSIGSVTALHVFEHISDDDLALTGAEFSRLLKPGGRILAVMPDLNGYAHAIKGSSWSAFRDPTHINLKSADEWRCLFEKQWEMDVVVCFSDGYYDFPYGASRVRSILGDASRALRTFLQFLMARPFLRPGDGENVVFVIEKRA